MRGDCVGVSTICDGRTSSLPANSAARAYTCGTGDANRAQHTPARNWKPCEGCPNVAEELLSLPNCCLPYRQAMIGRRREKKCEKVNQGLRRRRSGLSGRPDKLTPCSLGAQRARSRQRWRRCGHRWWLGRAQMAPTRATGATSSMPSSTQQAVADSAKATSDTTALPVRDSTSSPNAGILSSSSPGSGSTW